MMFLSVATPTNALLRRFIASIANELAGPPPSKVQ